MLTKILEQIRDNETHANTPVEREPTNTYTGRLGRQQRALQSLKDLKEQYRKVLQQSSMFLIVTGSGRDDFTGIATGDSYRLFASNPSDLFVDIANRVNPALYQTNHNTLDIFEILGRYLEDKAMELGVTEYPQPIFKQEYRRTITTKEGVVQFVSDIITQQVGAELVGLQSVYSLVDHAIKIGHVSKTTPIVLNTESEKLTLDLLAALPRIAKNVHLVVAGKASKSVKSVPGALLVKDVSDESVGHTLTTIKKSVK